MYNQNNKINKHENPSHNQHDRLNQYNNQINSGQQNPPHFPIDNSIQQNSQNSNYQSTSEQSVGLSTNYTSSKINNSKIKLISRGNGINDNEYNIITSSCIKIQDSKAPLPLSIKCIQKIKEKIGGEWFVFVVPKSETNYDFYLSYAKGRKYLSFSYSGNIYYINKIRE